jgi:hypothetical protein
MKDPLRDTEAIRGLSLPLLAGYLDSTGWSRSQEASLSRYAEAWTYGSAREAEIVLPVDHTVNDYVARIREAMDTLAAIEERPASEIFNAVRLGSHDVIRVPLGTDGADYGIPLEEGVPVIEYAMEMMTAAACAAAHPRPYFRGNRPKEATEYLRGVRLGHTERGSYVLTILSFIPGEPQMQLLETQPQAREPFARRATTTLSGALATLQKTAETSMIRGDLDDFRGAANHGVSANLCDAIAGISGEENGRSVTVDIAWAVTRPRPEVPSAVEVSKSLMPVIRSGSTLLKQSAPMDISEIEGVVFRLERDEQTSMTGEINIKALIDGKDRKVSVELNPEDYHKALEAHDRGWRVHCEGELVKGPSAYVLRRPIGFRPLPPNT